MANCFAALGFRRCDFRPQRSSFENPDHVAIVVHNYRWRLGLAEGEPKYDDLEKRLAAAPVLPCRRLPWKGTRTARRIRIRAPMPEVFRQIPAPPVTGGIGHNLPQEAPQAFAQAVIDVAAF